MAHLQSSKQWDTLFAFLPPLIYRHSREKLPFPAHHYRHSGLALPGTLRCLVLDIGKGKARGIEFHDSSPVFASHIAGQDDFSPFESYSWHGHKCGFDSGNPRSNLQNPKGLTDFPKPTTPHTLQIHFVLTSGVISYHLRYKISRPCLIVQA